MTTTTADITFTANAELLGARPILRLPQDAQRSAPLPWTGRRERHS